MFVRASVVVVTALALAGCVENMSWKTIKAPPAPSRFSLAPNGDVWGSGPVVMRRAGGTWTLLDVCGPHAKSLYYSGDKQVMDVAFGAGGQLWVLCGNTTMEGQVLLRYDAGGAGVEITLPSDADLQLVQLDADVALLGKQHLYQHAGDQFTEVAAAPPKLGLAFGAGHTIDDLYTSTDVGLEHWNGTAWLPVTLPMGNRTAFAPLALRGGQLFAGALVLAGEAATDIVHDNAAGLARGLLPVAAVDASSAIFMGTPPHDSFTATGNAYFWYGKSGADDFEFLGDAPFYSGSLYSAGGQSTFAIDAHTIAVLNSNGTKDTLLEGTQ